MQSQRRSGISRRARPASPAPAASADARMAAAEVTMVQPAGSQGTPPRSRYAVQVPAPRSEAAADMVLAVVVACSMYGRKLNEYLPCSSSGIAHQAVAAMTAAHHARLRRMRWRPRAWVTMYKAGSTRTASVDTALTPAIAATARPERAAARVVLARPCTAGMSGRTAHGTIRPGSA